MKTKFSYTLEGITFTRSSDRVYTHVVIGRKDIASLRREYSQANATDRSNAEYYKAQIEGTHPHAHQRICSAKTGQEKTLADGWSTNVQTNIDRQVRTRCELLEQNIANGLGKLTVLQWSMSLKNAQKGAQKWAGLRYINIEVRPL
jgi:hypothetical protein